MKSPFLLIFTVLFSFPLLGQPVEQNSDKDFKTVLKQFCDYQRESWRAEKAKAASHGPSDEELAQIWMKSLSADGTWPDVNYTDQDKGFWRTSMHLVRLNKMCMVYTSPECNLHGDKALSAAIHSALDHWLAKDYHNPNWWHNLIGVPSSIATIMALIEDELTPEEKEGGVKILSHSQMETDNSPEARRNGGQNRLNIAENVLLRGMLTDDSALAKAALDEILSEVTVSAQPGALEPKVAFKPGGHVFLNTEDGIQPDQSYQMHGPLIQLGGYGLLFGASTTRWMTILHGTPFAVSEDKVAIVRNFLLDGESPVVWKGAMDINAVGRQLLPDAQIAKGKEVVRIIKQAQNADQAHTTAYETAINEISPDASQDKITPKNIYFWRSDYMVQRRPTFYASTRMNSCRTYGTETGNGDNLLGTYLGDGATYLYQTGHEYEGIFPVWDWCRIPGVTCPASVDKKKLKHPAWKATNLNAFVGGVSDGLHGSCVMTLDRDGVSAKKSWFYLDDRIVCLGAGINSTGPTAITTSINQCLSNGDVTVAQDGAPSVAAKEIKDYPQLKWALHHGVGYFFPDSPTVFVGTQDQSGDIKEVMGSCKSEQMTKNVFSIWINHGVGPKDAGYSYILLPGATPQTLQDFSAKPDVSILSNTPTLQAVRSEKLQLTQAIFHVPGTLNFSAGKTITVDQPCVVQLNEGNNQLSVSDPTQKLTALTVTVNGVATTCTLPSGPRAGSTLNQQL